MIILSKICLPWLSPLSHFNKHKLYSNHLDSSIVSGVAYEIEKQEGKKNLMAFLLDKSAFKVRY